MFFFFLLKKKSAFIFHIIARTPFPYHPVCFHPSPILHRLPLASVPAEGDVSRSVATLFHQRLVELSSGPGVDGCPAVLAVVLQTGHVGAEERGKLASAAGALALIAQLVI